MNKYEQRTKLIADMREVLDGKDGLSADNQTKFADLEKSFEKLETEIRAGEKLASIESKLADFQEPGYKPSGDPTGSRSARNSGEDYRNAFTDGYARKGVNSLTREHSNALQVGTDSEGGYIVPEEFETRIYEILQTLDPVRAAATVITTGSDRNIPIEASVGSFAYIAEEAAYATTDPAFGRKILNSYKSGGIIKVSEELLQDSFFDVPSYLIGLAARRFNSLEETAFAAGTGSAQPTGLFVDTLGGNVAGAVSATAAITGDNLIDTFHALGRSYRQNASWLVSDALVKLVRKLKDSNGQYIWQPGLAAGQPDRILNRPVLISEGAVVPAASAKSIVFGDLSFYTIADRLGMTMQRLNELYAANGQVGFRWTKRNDAKVVDANAFVSFTHGAAS
jgi:HK97 family phage major capsid protein